MNRDNPLCLDVTNGELIIKIGINRLDGNEYHPTLPALKFDDIEQWAREVMYAMAKEAEDGATPISDFIDESMVYALNDGSIGVNSDSPVCIGTCAICGEDQQPLIYAKEGKMCPSCNNMLYISAK